MNPFTGLATYSAPTAAQAEKPTLRGTGTVTSRIFEYVKEKPGCTAYQIEQGTGIGWNATNMTLSHLTKKMGLLRSRKQYAEKGAYYLKNFCNHYWVVE